MAGEYFPETLDQSSIENLAASIQRELVRISIGFEKMIVLVEPLHVAPEKPREFRIVGADGVDWNPGGGRGVYAYISGTWQKLN